MSGRWTGVLWRLRWAALGLLMTASCARRYAAEAPGSGASGDLEALERDFEVSAAELAGQLQQRAAEWPRPAPTAGGPAPVQQGASPKKSPERAQEKDARAGDDHDVAVTDATSEAEANASEAAAPAPAPEATGEGYSAGASSCDLMCRALASMERSARGICALTSEAHERCASARSRLEVATRQVKDAGCVCRS